MFENLCAKILKRNKRFLGYSCGLFAYFARNAAMDLVYASIGMATPKERKEKTRRERKINNYTFFE